MKKKGNIINYTNKSGKKTKNKIESYKLKDKTTYINLGYTGNNSTRSTNAQTPLFLSTTLLSFEYEIVLQKLLRYLKQKLTIIQYEDIKSFINNEIYKIINNKSVIYNNNHLEKNDSLNYIIKTSKSQRNSEQNSNTTFNNTLYTNINKFNSSYKKKKNNEKKLKLSYDFSNILVSSPKNKKPIKIDLGNIMINKKAKSNSKLKEKKKINNNNNKESYSLYSMINNSHSYQKKRKKNTQSNSKSKSKSSEHINNKINKIENTSNYIYNNSNNNIKEFPQKNKKVTIKSTFISQPLLNEKLFSKLTNSNKIKNSNSNNKNKIICDSISNISVSKITKNISCKTESNLSHMINISLSNKTNLNNENGKNNNSSQMNSYRKKINSKNKKIKSIKKTNNKTITINIPNQNINLSPNNNKNLIISNNFSSRYRNRKSNILDDKKINLSHPHNQSHILKNDEMLKQIKNTIDDNLKLMFNFSYENFLSRESENESKDYSKEIEMNHSHENI